MEYLMSDISWIPDSVVTGLTLAKGLLAFAAVIFAIYNMTVIWRQPELMKSQARRWRLYAIVAASMNIAWGSALQLNEFRDTYVFTYSSVLSIVTTVLLNVAMFFTWREDVRHAQKKLTVNR